MRPECEAENAARTKVALSANEKTNMSYLNDFDSELTKKLDSGLETAVIVRWVSEKILESYRNGITAGRNGAQVIRKGKSRRPFPPQTR